ncbi:MAG: galactose mutarotase [Proteobacteria bacterium]|nr:galactose mutarotase [Pseudomonadota bacterium]
MTDDLTLRTARSSLTVRADRGGMATRFEVAGAPVLFMDEGSLADPTKNVRGGNPVLFPSPGKLVGDTAAFGGTLNQHGFARELPWRVLGSTGGDEPTIALELASSADTRARYPWDFTLQLTYALRGTTLRIDQRVDNHSATPMPFGLGFHPYFFVPQADKHAVRVETAATRAFDNVTKRAIAMPALDLTQPEVDLHLLDHGATSSALQLPDVEIRIRGSDEYTHWVVWTLAGRDFVCLEPWTCPGNALNTGERVIELLPNTGRSLWIDLTVTRRLRAA